MRHFGKNNFRWLVWLGGLLVFSGTDAAAQLTGTAGQQAKSLGEILFRTNFDPVPRKAMEVRPTVFTRDPVLLKKLRRDSVYLFQGIRLLQEDKPGEALHVLQTAARGMKELVNNASEWYLALAYLRLNRLEHAEFLFHKIAETEIHPYQDEAELVYQQLLRK